ncbi:protein Niban 2-like [Pogona vitticeps]
MAPLRIFGAPRDVLEVQERKPLVSTQCGRGMELPLQAKLKVLEKQHAYKNRITRALFPEWNRSSWFDILYDGPAPKSGSASVLKCPTQFPLILWHPYARHYYFCVMTGKEQEKWRTVFQDCVRHCNNGIPEDSKVEAPAFTDAVRMYRQSKEQYGTRDMLCGNEAQVLTNLVMEELLPELKNMIGPRLKGKAQERHRVWIQVSDAVYRMVYDQTKAHYEAVVVECELQTPSLQSTIRTDMDQIIQSKEHLTSKIRASVFSKAEICVRNHVQPYIASILEALMIPTSQGFAEVREVFFKEVTDMNLNIVNEGGTEKLGEYMEKLSQLAFHPVKMQSCYEKMDQLKLEGLQQRFDVSSASVFKQRAQILMRQQMDDTVYTFETLLHQELGKSLSKDDLCKAIQRILERVLEKHDYDSSTVRKKFFREALLQITIPFLLKKLAPTCKGVRKEGVDDGGWSGKLTLGRLVPLQARSPSSVNLPFSSLSAVKEAAVQRKHNLYRGSIVMHNSDPNLHLLGEGTPIDWEEEFGCPAEADPSEEKQRRAKQVMSVIQVDEGAPPYDVASLEEAMEVDATGLSPAPPTPGSPESLKELRTMLVKEFQVEAPVPAAEKTEEPLSNGTVVQENQAIRERAEEEKEEEEKGEAAPRADGHLPEKSPKRHEKEEEVPEGTAVSPLPPPSSAAEGGVPMDHPLPDDKETGEVTAATAVCEARNEAPSEDSHRAMDDHKGAQTQF